MELCLHLLNLTAGGCADTAGVGVSKARMTQSLFYLAAGNRSKVARHCGPSCEHAICRGLARAHRAQEPEVEEEEMGKNPEDDTAMPKQGELAQGEPYIPCGSY